MTKRFFSLRGFMKSGTNWLGSLLSSHANVCVVGEFHWEHVLDNLDKIMANEPVFNTNAKLTKFAQEEFEEFVRKVLVRKAEPTATVIGERTPHTIKPLVFKNAPVISIVRDGRDVLISRAFHLFNEPGVHRLFKRIPAMAKDLERFQADRWFFHKHPEMLLRHETMVRESVRWWRDHLVSDRKTIQERPDIEFRSVRYEDLHRDTEGERAKLFEFLNVAPDKAAKIAGVLKAGFSEERPTEFLRKGIVGDWKNYFTDQTKQWFQEEAGDELQINGYVGDANAW